MKNLIAILISGALVVSAYAQTRNVLVGTNNTVVQPTNFWSADASNARTGLGLGSAATNPASAFQPASSALTNLSLNNAAFLTNLQASNLIGTINVTNIPAVTLTNINGVLSISQGGTGATNASGARTALELDTAATNPSTAFQSASSALTNLASSNGGFLTNITAANIIGTVGLASNITGTAPLATNVTGVVALANGGTAGTNAASARTSLGATTVGANLFTLANPDDVRFIRLNANNSVSALSAADMRTALSVGTNVGTVTSVGMTVPNIFSLSTATITSSGTFGLTLTNQSSRYAFLAPNGGGTPAFRAIESDDLPSLAISKVTGLQTALDGKLSTSGTAALATNVTGIVALANGGTGGTNAESGRAGLGATTVGSAVFTLPNPSAIRFLRLNADNTVSALSDSDFRTAIGLGTASTNPATAFQPSSSNLTNLAANNGASLTNIPLAGVIGALATNGSGAGLTNLTAANITGTVGLASNVTGTIAISNGGSGATTAGGARTNLGLGATNNVVFNSVTTELLNYGTNFLISLPNQELYDGGIAVLSWSTNSIEINAPILLATSNAISTTRTNLGLGWTALTNTTASGFQASLFGANTNPVLVNTNGEVVSPTNFWQEAPINTVLQNITNVVGNATNAATNARMLFLYSLAPTVTNVTSTITLPTNGSTFGGDVATITHLGPTSSVTAIRALGASTNFISLNQPEESVRFIYRDNQWKLMDNISYIEPIFFSGTNAAANAAASRTNLGLGESSIVRFDQLFATDTVEVGSSSNTVQITTDGIEFGNATLSATTRTNLGLGATNNVTFNNVTASGTLTATSTVTAKTNLVVEGFVDFTTNATNSNPATNNQIQDFIEIRVGTNQFWLPVYK